MTTTETTRIYDRFRLTPAPEGWVCTGRSQVRGDQEECWGGLVQYEVYDRNRALWVRTYKAACQRIDHRTATTNQIQSEGYYPGVVFDGTASSLDGLPLLFNPPTPPAPEPTPEPPSTTVDLPGHTDLQRQVLSYLLGNDGTVGMRHTAFQWLTERGVFHPGISDSIVTDYLEGLVDENPMSACPEGLQRFRAEFGLTPGPQLWTADLVQADTDVRLATVSWTCETDDASEAEEFLTNQQSLGDIDTHLRSSLYELDGGEHRLDFAGHFDVVLANIDHIGPAV